MSYCYPTYGFFSCSPIAEYEFDSTKDPNVTYGQSPACKLSTRIYRKLDITSAFASLGAGNFFFEYSRILHTVFSSNLKLFAHSTLKAHTVAFECIMQVIVIHDLQVVSE